MDDKRYQQLITEVKNLKIVLVDTKEQLAKSTAESKALREVLLAEREENKQSTKTNKGEASSESKPPGIPTGVTDQRGEELFLDDIVRLTTGSTGSFLRINKFREGDTAEVYGITKNYDIKIRDPENHKIRTVRKGNSVLRVWNQL